VIRNPWEKKQERLATAMLLTMTALMHKGYRCNCNCDVNIANAELEGIKLDMSILESRLSSGFFPDEIKSDFNLLKARQNVKMIWKLLFENKMG
jgi:hypothetical protein